MVSYLYLLHRCGGYFTSISTISAGFVLVKSEKFIPSIFSVALTFSRATLIFGEPIHCCGESQSISSVSLGSSVCQIIDEVLEQFDVFCICTTGKL